jgi:hypothetical protein
MLAPPVLDVKSVIDGLANAWPFSSKPAAESASRFYTTAPAAPPSAATALCAYLQLVNEVASEAQIATLARLQLGTSRS